MTLLTFCQKYRIMYELPWITFLGTCEAVCQWYSRVTKCVSENHKRIASRVTKNWSGLPLIFTSDEVISNLRHEWLKKGIHGNELLFYFLHAILCPEHTIPLRQLLNSPMLPRTVFSDLAMWCNHSWSVTSRTRQVLALWRHIRQLFLRTQIDAKAIFTGE